MVKVIVCGALGRAGGQIARRIYTTQGMELVGAIEAPHHPSLEKEIYEGVRITSRLEKAIRKDAVVVEFTTPGATIEHLEIAEKAKVPMIIGTTGLKKEQQEKIKEAAKSIPVIPPHNFGVGMNFFFRLVEQTANFLGEDYDTEIIEYHGRDKKDAPSGTAGEIARIIAKVKGVDIEKTAVYGRRGLSKETRDRNTIGIMALRGGGYKSNHTVIFAGDGETIELTHREESLAIIARGVIMAIGFIAGKKSGIYNMADVLGLRKPISTEGN